MSGSELDGEFRTSWYVAPTGGAGGLIDMGTGELGHTWDVTIDMGTHIPRTTDTTGGDAAVSRDAHADGTYDVTFSGQPTTIEDNSECDTSVSPNTCPHQAMNEVTYFGGELSDFGQWTDATQRHDFYGMDSWSNIEVYDIPPSIIGDPAQLEVQMANSHLRPNDTVFQGFYHLSLPNAFLSDMGVDDPSTLSGSGLSASIGAGTATITPGASAVQVDVTGITFSARTLKVRRGNVLPSKPSKVVAHRSSSHSVRLKFHHAKARGSKITGYQGRCKAHHQKTRSGASKHSPMRIKKVARKVHYTCQVRAKSKAGHGPWSRAART